MALDEQKCEDGQTDARTTPNYITPTSLGDNNN